MIVIFVPQISKSFEIVTRKCVSNRVVSRRYPDSRDSDVEQSRDEEKSLQRGDCWTADRPFIDRFNDCLVVTVNEQFAIFPVGVPEEECV